MDEKLKKIKIIEDRNINEIKFKFRFFIKSKKIFFSWYKININKTEYIIDINFSVTAKVKKIIAIFKYSNLSFFFKDLFNKISKQNNKYTT